MKDIHFESSLAQGGQYIDLQSGGIVPPIQPSITFARNSAYELIGEYSYSRYQNPTYDQVERLCACLDGAVEAKLFSSGMAAITAVFETVRAGQHIVAPEVMYHGAQDWLRRISETRDIGLTFFDPRDANSILEAMQPGRTSVVWIETPVNPTWDVIDIRLAAKVAHDHGAILAVDNTVATPISTQAIGLGADIVCYSGTKYLNGHSDAMVGVLVTRERNDRWEEIKLVRKYVGSVPGPFEVWLLLRGMRTLAIRYERASKSAMKMARHFESHPMLEATLYPGLKSHPGHKVARKQMTNGFGGMISLLLKGGVQEALRVASSLRLFLPATSFGGVESLVEHRATVEGPLSQTPPNLLRLSIGLENPQDLIQDLEQALNGSKE